MEDYQQPGLCYNCDENYVRAHKCQDQNMFQIHVTSQTTPEELTLEETPKIELDDHTITTHDVGKTKV